MPRQRAERGQIKQKILTSFPTPTFTLDSDIFYLNGDLESYYQL